MEAIYRQEVNRCFAYRISANDFNNWLSVDRRRTDEFIKRLRKWTEEEDYNTLYELAVDYSVPIIILKWQAQWM